MNRHLTSFALVAALAAPVAQSTAPAVAEPRPTRAATPAPAETPPRLADRLGSLERVEQARIGVLALDTGTGRVVQYRGDERFAFASTIKTLVAGAVLDRLDRKGLERRVRWTEDDLVTYSPVTSQHVEDGLTVRELIGAALTVSDNTAANLLVEILGGPDGLERELRRLGDRTTSVDRLEPELNTAIPGDPRDTTTPRALARSLERYALGDVLPASDRALLRHDMAKATTGLGLVRAGVPRTWQVGDKSGSAEYGTRNDVAVVRPPGRAPIVLAVLTTHTTPDAATDDELVAEATRAVVAELGPRR